MIVVGTAYLNGCNYQVGYDLLSQDTANNSSRVRFYGVLNVTNNYISWSRGTASVRNTSVGIGTYYSKGSYTLVTEEVTIYHNGNGDFGENLTGSLNTTFVSGTASGYYSLPHINRYPILTSGSNFSDEENPTLNFTSYGTFPIRVKLEVGSNTQLITRDLSNKNAKSYTIELTDEERETLRALTPNSNELTVRETVCAMNGNTELNYSYKDYKMTIVNANPTFNNFTFQDTNTKTISLTGDNQSIISGYSDVEVTISLDNKAMAKKKTTMNKYRVTIGESNSKDITYSSTASVNTTLQKVTSGVINTYAIDSRNNSTLVTKQATNIINYTAIQKGSINAVRDEGRIGENVTLSFDGEFDNVNFGLVTNSIKTATYTIQRTDSSTITSGITNIIPTINGNYYSFEGVIAGDTEEVKFDIGSSYIIKVTIKDELSTATYTFTLNSGVPNIALHKNGVGIMGKYDENIGGLLQLHSRRIDYFFEKCFVKYINPFATSGLKLTNDFQTMKFYYPIEEQNKKFIVSQIANDIRIIATEDIPTGIYIYAQTSLSEITSNLVQFRITKNDESIARDQQQNPGYYQSFRCSTITTCKKDDEFRVEINGNGTTGIASYTEDIGFCMIIEL